MNKLLVALQRVGKVDGTVATVILALSVFWLYAHNLAGFWRGDDTVILLHMLSYPLSEIFFSPPAWQALSQVNLTPWLSASLSVDYFFAGLSPEFYYWHQLLVLMLIAVASYFLLALFTGRIWAFAGSFLFFLGAPAASVAAQLMTRHYVEGLLFALLSLYFFCRHQRGGGRGLLFASVLMYVLAVTAKEIYVPLGVLLVILALTDGRDRVRQAAPFLLVILLYIAWRAYMLPGLADGYVTNTDYFSVAFWQTVIVSLLRLPVLVLGVYTLVVLVLFAFPVLALGVKGVKQYGLWVLLCAGSVCAPLVPLVYFPGLTVPDRYVLLPWYLFCFAAAFFTGKALDNTSGNGRARHALAAALCLWAVTCILVPRARVDYLQSIDNHFRIVDTQMRFMWNGAASVAFAPTPEVASALYMLPALQALKQRAEPGSSPPKPVVDDRFLDAGLPLFAYSDSCACMVDISAEIPARLQAFAASNQTRPLSLELVNEDGLMSWTFGPYQTGAYNIVIENMGSTRLPASQRMQRTLIRDDVDFYLRYAAPEGWITYSPLQHLEPDGVPVTWARN